MAGELAEQEEIPMEHHAPETAEELEPEKHTHIAQADGSPDAEDDPLDVELEDDADDTQPETAVVSQAEDEVAGEAIEETGHGSES